jgi:hypothetical protein
MDPTTRDTEGYYNVNWSDGTVVVAVSPGKEGLPQIAARYVAC